MNEIKNITVVGTGVIGAGWIARFLSHGYQVTAFDPAPGAEEKLNASLEDLWPTLVKNDIAQADGLKNLSFETDLETAVKNADFIQENVPEREDIKRQVLAEIDGLTKVEAIISSSTSGYMPSLLQKDCQHPERVIVSHPFNPVYLIPLVEVVGGEQTDPETVLRAQALFEAVDMKPLIVRNEIDGHIGDRLMEAIWREALHIVNDGIATTNHLWTRFTLGAYGTFPNITLSRRRPRYASHASSIWTST